jgi:hypothetical protein
MVPLHFHPMIQLESKVNTTFPQLERVFAVFDEMDKTCIFEEDESTFPSNELLLELNSLRNKSLPYTWIHESSLSILGGVSQFGQLNLEAETKHRTLVLYFRTQHVSKADLLFLVFPENTKFFGIQKEIASFTTDEKIMVAELLFKMLQLDFETILKQQKRLKQAVQFKTIHSQHNSILESENSVYKSFFKDVVMETISRIENQLRIGFQIHESALNELAKVSSDLSALKKNLQEACEFASYLNPELHQIELHHFHIQSVLSQEEVSPIERQSTQQKVIDLLDKYEEAATKAQRLGFAVNGKFVAAQCNPPISPPAVSESLKKYSDKIGQLLKQHPNQWKLIRKALKPIREKDFLQGDGEGMKRVV